MSQENKATLMRHLLERYSQVLSLQEKERIVVDMIDCFSSSTSSEHARVHELFGDWLIKTPRMWITHSSLTSAHIERLFDAMLAVCSRPPNAIVFLVRRSLLLFLTQDEKAMHVFEATPDNIKRTGAADHLGVGGAGPFPRELRELSVKFIVGVLQSRPQLDLDDVLSDPVAIAKVSLVLNQSLNCKLEEFKAELMNGSLIQTASLNTSRSAGEKVDEAMMHSQVEMMKTQLEACQRSVDTLTSSMNTMARSPISQPESASPRSDYQKMAAVLGRMEERLISLETSVAEKDQTIVRLANKIAQQDLCLQTLQEEQEVQKLTPLKQNTGLGATSTDKVKQVCKEMVLLRDSLEQTDSSPVLRQIVSAVESVGSSLKSAISASETLWQDCAKKSTPEVDRVTRETEISRKELEASFTRLKESLEGQNAQLRESYRECQVDLSRIRSTIQGHAEALQAVEAFRSTTLTTLETIKIQSQPETKDNHETIERMDANYSRVLDSIDKLNSTASAHQYTLQDFLKSVDAHTSQIESIQESMKQTRVEAQTALKVSYEVDTAVESLGKSIENVKNTAEQTMRMEHSTRGAVMSIRDACQIHDDWLARLMKDGQENMDPFQRTNMSSINSESFGGNLPATRNSAFNEVKQKSATFQQSVEPRPPTDKLSRPTSAATSRPTSARSRPMSARSGVSQAQSTQEYMGGDIEVKAAELSTALEGDKKYEAIKWLCKYIDFATLPQIQPACENFLTWASSNSSKIRILPHNREALHRAQVAIDGVVRGDRNVVGLALADCLLKFERNVEPWRSLGGIASLTQCLQSDSRSILVYALRCLKSCFREDSSLTTFVAAGGLKELGDLLLVDAIDVQEAAAYAVKAATRMDMAIEEMVALDLITIMVKTIDNVSDEKVRLPCVGALRNSCRVSSAITAIMHGSGLPVLYSAADANANSESIRQLATSCLKLASKNVDVQVELQRLGALDMLGLKYRIV